MEQPQAAEGHGDAVLVAGIDDLLVADGAAGLHDGGHAGAAGALDVVAEGEESVRTKANTGHLAEISLLFLGGQRLGLAGNNTAMDACDRLAALWGITQPEKPDQPTNTVFAVLGQAVLGKIILGRNK